MYVQHYQNDKALKVNWKQFGAQSESSKAAVWSELDFGLVPFLAEACSLTKLLRFFVLFYVVGGCGCFGSRESQICDPRNKELSSGNKVLMRFFRFQQNFASLARVICTHSVCGTMPDLPGFTRPEDFRIRVSKFDTLKSSHDKMCHRVHVLVIKKWVTYGILTPYRLSFTYSF